MEEGQGHFDLAGKHRGSAITVELLILKERKMGIDFIGNNIFTCVLSGTSPQNFNNKFPLT